MFTDIGTEKFVLSGLYKYGKDAEAELSGVITPECFTEELNSVFYKVLCHALQFSERLDSASLVASSESLNVRKYLATKKSEIKEIIELDVHLDNVKRLGGKLRKLDITRKLYGEISNSQDVLCKVTGDEKLDEILSIVEEPIHQFCHNVGISNDNEAEPLHVGLQEYIDELIANPVDQIGIPTGFPYLDAAIGGGVIHGGFSLIGARMKVGKSTLADQIAMNTSLKFNVPTLMLDTEMFKQKHWYRILANITGIDVNRIRTGQFRDDQYQLNLVQSAVNQINQSKYAYKNVAGKGFTEILSIARRWLHKNVDLTEKIPKCMIILDYFKLSHSDSKSDKKEHELIGHQASQFSDFCIKYNVPAIAFVQLNRQGIDKESSDVISQSDRLGWSCTSFTIFKEKTKDEISEDGPHNGNRKIIPLFTRDGEPICEDNWINAKFEGKYSKVTELNTNLEAKSGQATP